MSVVSPASASGLVGTQVKIQGTGFYPAGSNGFVIIYLVPSGGGLPEYEASAFGVTSATFTAYFSILQSYNLVQNLPGAYTLWAANGFQPATCASAGFTITGTPPSAIGCTAFPYYAKLTVTSPSPASGPVGSAVMIQGQGFWYVGSTSIYWSSTDGTAYTQLSGAVPSSPYGWFNVSETIPSGYTPGNFLFWAVDSMSNCGGVFFVLTAPATTFTLSPTSGPPGSQVTASGTGFAADSAIVFTLDSEYAASACSTDSTGAFPGTSGTPCDFTVPDAPNGDNGGQNVVAVDTSSGRATASFSVTPEVTLTPIAGAMGTTFTVSGSGFTAFPSAAFVEFGGQELTPTGGPDCNFDNSPLITLDLNGGFVCSFTPPPWAKAGANVVQGDDTVSGELTADQTFTVTGPSLISLLPGTGPIGSPFTITGSGFTRSSDATVAFENGALAQTPLKPVGCAWGSFDPSTGVITTDKIGGFVCAFTVPRMIGAAPVSPGVYSVFGDDQATGFATPSRSFAVTGPALVWIHPGSGPVGSSFTVLGAGFTHSSQATVSFESTTLGASTLIPTFCTWGSFKPGSDIISTDKAGGFECAFTAPISIGAHPVALGAYDVFAEDLTTRADTAPLPFTVVQSLISISPGRGPVAATFTVTGSGFVVSTKVTVSFQDAARVKVTLTPLNCAWGTLTLGIVTTDKVGGFVCTFSVPAKLGGKLVTPGGYDVVAADLTTGTVTPPVAFTVTQPSITIQPNRGSVGSAFKVTGSGFSVSSEVSVSFEDPHSRVSQILIPTSCTWGTFNSLTGIITTDKIGGFVCSFLVPSTVGTNVVGPGIYDVLAKDLATGAMPRPATYSVT